MEKVCWQDALKRAFFMCFACLFGNFGTLLFYVSNAGSMPLSSFQQAVNLRTGWSFTVITWVINGVVLLYFLARKDFRFIHVGTIVSLFFPGPLMDFYNWIFRGLYDIPWGVAGYWLLPLVGAVSMGIGQSIWYPASIGTGPTDMPLLALQVKGWSFQKAYFLIQGCWVVAGLFLHAQFGWGTLVGFVFQGPVSNFFMRFTKERVYRSCYRFDQMAREGMLSEEEADRLMAEHRALRDRQNHKKVTSGAPVGEECEL